MRLPIVRGTAVQKSILVKSKWDIIHYIMLMMNMEESLTEQTGRHLLEVFLFLHVDCISKVSHRRTLPYNTCTSTDHNSFTTFE